MQTFVQKRQAFCKEFEKKGYKIFDGLENELFELKELISGYALSHMRENNCNESRI